VHPVTADVNWNEAGIIGVAPMPAAGGGGEWTPVLRLRDRVAVAVREAPARQVRNGFDAPGFARTADFAVFWPNVLDWVGGGGAEQFAASPASAALGEEWRRADLPEVPAAADLDPAGGALPGLYRRADGAVRAVNVTPVTLDAPATAPTTSAPAAEGAAAGAAAAQQAALKLRSGRGLQLESGMLLAALACLLVAAGAWPRHRLTRFSSPRTV
jgi:hypothetical protein